VVRRVYYNPSTSAPRGWYWRAESSTYPVGTLTFARLPEDAAKTADDRQYIPRTVPLLKRVVAVQGYRVCESGGTVRINGQLVASALERDGQGRNLRPWDGCRVLARDEFFLLNLENSASFDSRYFGPIVDSMFLGKAIPLWTW
jgi:conjugative transfer signal peptidase TraF